MTKIVIYRYIFCLLFTGGVASAIAQRIGITPVKIAQELPSLTVNRTFQDSEGYIWFATASGLSRFDAFNLLNFKLPEDEGNTASNQNILNIKECSDHLLLGTENGLYLLDKKNYQIRAFPDSNLRSLHIGTILVDQQSRIWIGSYNGIYVYNKDFSLHTVYQHDPLVKTSIPPGSVNTIFQDQQGDIWTAIWGGGLHKLNRKTNTFQAFPPIGKLNSPFKITQDDRGQYWVSTWGDGLFLFNPNDKNSPYREIIINNKRRGTGKEHLVYNILQDHIKKYIWVLSYSGISTFHYTDSGEIEELNIADSFQHTSNFLQDIYEDRSGILWLAISGEGISTISFDRPAMRSFDLEPIQQRYHVSPNINMLYRDRENQLWFNLERIASVKSAGPAM